MTKRFSTLALLALAAAALGAVPEMPRPKGNKFAVQLFRVDSPKAFNQESFKQDNASIERLFSAEENKVTAYPVVYADVGKSAVSDQTKSVMLPDDFHVVDGQLVPVESLQHIGVRAEVGLREFKNTAATFTRKFHYQEITGYDEYKLKGGHSARVPLYETRKVDTELTQVLGSWVVVGGIETEVEGEAKTAYFIVRVTRPSAGFGSGNAQGWQSL